MTTSQKSFIGPGSSTPQAATTIAFVHHKGGTGKTTSCLNVAGWLVKLGKNVLVVDLDPQGNATAGLGIDRASCDATVADLFFSGKRIETTIFQTDCGVRLLPASIDLLVAETRLAGKVDNTVFLRKRLDRIADRFDYILIDVPPGSTCLMMNGIVASDNIIIPMDSGVFAYEALDVLKTLVIGLNRQTGIEVNIMLILLREYSRSVFDWGVNRQSRELLKDFLEANNLHDVPVMPVPFSRKIYDSQIKGLPISHYAPLSGVGTAYRKIAEQIMLKQISTEEDDHA